LTISSTENESPTEENSEKLLIVRHKINKKKKGLASNFITNRREIEDAKEVQILTEILKRYLCSLSP
jgi:hypothetical protein